LSRATGIGEGLISEYLSGKKEPTGRNSILIAKALGASLDELWAVPQMDENKKGTMKGNLWESVGNKCLAMAEAMLSEKTTPTAATVEVVEKLVDIAIRIDTLNLHWETKSRSSPAALRDWAFLKPEE
jgi:transcriptional regulator with XRE-family HTH domain